MTWAVVCLQFAAYLAPLAPIFGGWVWLLLWPAASFALFVAAYAAGWPRRLGKRANGQIFGRPGRSWGRCWDCVVESIVEWEESLPALRITFRVWCVEATMSGDKPEDVPRQKLTPEFLAWAASQVNEEEVAAAIREIRETGGLQLKDFIHEVERETLGRE